MSRLMLKQEYPPTKVQPQPSATRDDGATRHNRPLDYDKIDAEAGSILIALANQEPQRLKGEDAKSDNNRLRDGDGDVVMASNQRQNGADRQSVVVSGNNPPSSMSISSLLGGGNGLSSSSGGNTLTSQDRAGANGQRAEQDVASDPIMLLAAAAAAIDGRADESAGLYSAERAEKRSTGASYGYYSQHYERPADHPKKSRGHYYEKDVDEAHARPARPPQQQHLPPAAARGGRYESQAGARPEGTNAFSYQYMSMKQNPRIKRNAMHAYITYMIYTDMAQRDRAKPVDKRQEQHHYNGFSRKGERFGEFNAASSYRREMSSYVPSRSAERYHHRNNNNNNNNSGNSPAVGGLVQDHYSEPSSWYPPVAAAATAAAAAASTTPTSSSYRLPPSPSTPQPPVPPSSHEPRSSQQSSPAASVTSNSNPIMMGKPLTAFLRDEHHAADNRRSFPFSSQSSPASSGRRNLI